jgi:exodeoxyribonuclease VII small subunit
VFASVVAFTVYRPTDVPGKKTNSIASFESEFERLTSIVDKLEAGNVPLSEMIELYEEAMRIAANLKDVLGEAELRVEKLAATHEEIAGTTTHGNDIPESEDLY